MFQGFHGIDVIVSVLVLAMCELNYAAGSSSPIELLPGCKQLFLDDLLVAQASGLTRRMHQPVKKGAVLKPDIPSDGSLVQTRMAPLWAPEEGVYKIIYLAYGRDDRGRIGPALAISKDGVHWRKPQLGMVTVNGSKQNNRLRMPERARGDEFDFYNAIYDPDDPNPQRRYKGLMGAVGRTPVVSPDCIHWQKLDVPELPSSDESTLTYDRVHHRFIALLKGSNRYGRAFNISTSEDFEHWSKPQFVFGADAKDQELALQVIRRRLADPGLAKPMFFDPDPATGWKPPNYYIPTWRCECYCMGVFPYEGIYLGLAMMYYPTGQSQPERNNTDGFDLIRLVMSRDLVHWRPVGRRQAFIGPSRIDHGLLGVFDRVQLAVPNAPVEHGDELWFYYTGFKWRVPIYDRWTDGSTRDAATLSDEERADLKDGWGAICLAVLRQDGFVSLDADEKEGVLLTKPLKLKGHSLWVNAEASHGEIRVQLVDGSGKPISGYQLAQAVPIKGDQVRQRIVWKDQESLDALSGQPVRLEFHLRRARLYALWVE